MQERSLCYMVVLLVTALSISIFSGCVQYPYSDSSKMGADEWPSPFCPTTKITFELPEQACVTLTIYNVLGHLVRIVLDEEMAAGSHCVTWDATDDDGNPVASGIYFWRVETEDFSETKKMILLR